MAKNYTFNEAVQIIAAGTDLEAITDIGRRFPVLAHKVAVVATKAGEDFVDLMGFMPEFLTANKVNSNIKATITSTSSSEDEDEGEAPKAMPTATEDDDVEGDGYDTMSANEIWKLMQARGLDKTVSSKKKGDRIEALRKWDAEHPDGIEEDTDDEAEESGNPYEGKSAMELFKECKKRGIKAAPKKPAKFYADLLVKNDAESTEAEDEGEDWGDEEATEEPKTKAAPKATKSTKATKPAKKAETKADDEDDDWDI